MSLNIKYLPAYSYKEEHSLSILGNIEEAMKEILNYQAHNDPFFKFAIALREFPHKIFKKTEILKPPFSLDNFTLLEKSSTQIAFGLVGQFWKSDYGQVEIKNREEFLEFKDVDYVKLVLYFDINQIDNDHCHITTETRVLCLGGKALSRFRPYWYLIRPISGLIRRRILLQIQKNIIRSKNI